MRRSTFLATAAALVSTAYLTACGSPPSDLDLSLQHPSTQGQFVVTLEPPASGPVLGQIQTWRLRLSTRDGEPVSQARILFSGGMPQHGHGFPTQPRVTREVSPGVYMLEGVKFSMSGWWDMRLGLQAGDRTDTAVFNVVLDDGRLRR
ncbi:FixH family protein [Roseateles sp.]|uniref:FixH family protein n=1 Tax=Roseateles sp. TaxID=1971397 RepID=UPI0025D67B1D|nr:FixH family protein [Roseateles sp.]MBV8034722.1 FixH family protein [Roseateles sp.]